MTEKLAMLIDRRDVSATTMFNSLETSQNVSALSKRRPDPAMELEGGKLDILVRTSNVKRLSDFMMWQVSHPTVGMPSWCSTDGAGGR